MRFTIDKAQKYVWSARTKCEFHSGCSLSACLFVAKVSRVHLLPQDQVFISMALPEMPVLAVFGATGTQGRSVVSALQSSHSPVYRIRGLTSNKSSDAARELSRTDVEVVEVDIGSEASIRAALEGAEAVFANTAFPPDVFVSQGAAAAEESESKTAVRMAHALAHVTTLKHLVWSTLPDGGKRTDGKLHIHHFQSKVAAAQFIRNDPELAKKTTMLAVGMYGSNLKTPGYLPIYDVSSGSAPWLQSLT